MSVQRLGNEQNAKIYKNECKAKKLKTYKKEQTRSPALPGTAVDLGATTQVQIIRCRLLVDTHT